MEVIRDIRKDITDDFSFHYINGLNFHRAESLYSDIHKFVFGKNKKPKEACKALGKIFLANF